MSDQPPVEALFYVGFLELGGVPGRIHHFSPDSFALILTGIEAKKIELRELYPDETMFKLTVMYSPEQFAVYGQPASLPDFSLLQGETQ